MEKPYNADFLITKHNEFYVRVLKTFNYKTRKPIVFLPCSKTKPYSKSLTHCYLSPITRDPNLERIVISEPLAVVPYSMEGMAPKYNYPPKDLTPQDRMILIRRVAIFLYILVEENHAIKKIYYIGGKHHYEVLKTACPEELDLIALVPPKGIRQYTEYARKLHDIIYSENRIQDRQMKLI